MTTTQTAEQLAAEMQRYGVVTMNRWATDAAAMLRSQAAEIDRLKAENAALKAELDKAQDELNCAEESCEAFACEFAEAGYDQGFECIGEFILALHMSSNTERDALKAENDRLQNDSLKWATSYSSVCDENAALKVRIERLNADLKEARKDAFRYQHCFTSDDFAVCDYERSAPFCEEHDGWRWMDKDQADKAIDAARAALG